MKVFSVRFSWAQSLLALVVSLALVTSAPILIFASPAKSSSPAPSYVGSKTAPAPTAAPQSELELTATSATAVSGGVLIHWSTNSIADNAGFNIYRIKSGERTRVNRQMIPGAMFGPGTPAMMRGGYSYSWFDRGGTVNSIYVIESISVDGNSKTHQAISAVPGKTAPGSESMTGSGATESGGNFERFFPAAESQLNSPQGAVEQQWVVAGQPALKIAIKKDGWYRVTQAQMVAAGFNPTVDIRNLRLFVDGTEVAIATSQSMGSFGSGGFIEFYGRGLDTPTTDSRTYYLIADTTPGKRVTGDLQVDSAPVDPPAPPAPPVPPAPTSTPPPAAGPIAPTIAPTASAPLLRDPIFFSWAQRDLGLLMDSVARSNPVADNREVQQPDSPATVNASFGRSAAGEATPDYSQPDSNPPVESRASDGAVIVPNATAPANAVRDDSVKGKIPVSAENARPLPSAVLGSNRSIPTVTAGKSGKSVASRKKAKRKSRRTSRREHSHALAADGFVVTNFNNTFQIKDRGVYLSNLQNGDEENFFGAVISSSVTQTLQLPNVDSTALESATLEFALQGVLNIFTGASHQVRVDLNGTTLGLVDFDPLGHPVRTFSIPAAQLLNGANTLKFTKTSTGELSIVDYVRLTYPHVFTADSGSLKFSLRGSQTRTVDGFAVPTIRLIDYTDPLAVKLTRPAAEPSGAGYAITVPPSESGSKDQRLLLAIPEGQFDTPASMTLNQPSTLNLNSNADDFVIISHKDFIPSLSPLVAKRQAEGHSVLVADVDDVYDEFGYGEHGPQAIKAFLQHASTHWATPPHYVIFAGDASFDPRNYTGNGNWDLVPTKLVDATYNETSSDDWMADFDDDGIGDISLGRLPVRSPAEADLVVSKLVNFTPLSPQSALLVADFQGNYYYSFENANDELETLLNQLVPQMTVNRINRPDNTNVESQVINKINDGQALVTYSGHGNVDIWSNSFSSNGATGLANGNKLAFVVVMDCLNGYYQDPTLLSLSEALLKAQNGGAIATFASSGLTLPDGQHLMSQHLFSLLYGAQPISLGDAIRQAKSATTDFDVRRTWILFGDPSLKIR